MSIPHSQGIFELCFGRPSLPLSSPELPILPDEHPVVWSSSGCSCCCRCCGVGDALAGTVAAEDVAATRGTTFPRVNQGPVCASTLHGLAE